MENKNIYCTQCGKELPAESEFCPYCMTKFTEETEIEPLSIKKKSKKPIIIAAAALIVIVAVVCGIVIPKLIDKKAQANATTESSIHSETMPSEPSQTEPSESNSISETITSDAGNSYDITDYLGADKLAKVREDFGEIEKISTVDEYETHEFGALSVSVNNYSPEYAQDVYLVCVIYNSENNSDFNFAGVIDGNSTLNDVTDAFGEPISEADGFLVDGSTEMLYYTSYGNLKVGIKDNQVVSLYYFS